jgi:competence protein ComEC
MPTLSTRTWLLLYAALILAVALSWREYRLLPDGNLHFYALDVGQGDSLFLVSPGGKQVLIDGGRDNTTLRELNKVMPFSDRTIDMLILSHPNLDHIAAFPDVLRRYKVGSVMMTGVRYDLGYYEEMLSIMRQKQIPIVLPDPHKDLDFGDGLVLDIIGPTTNMFDEEVEYEESNNTSIVFRALYKDQSILFTGDMEEEQERDILASGADIDATVLKVGHHGSNTSTSTGWLLATTPDIAVISAGRNNSYGHPKPSIIERLRRFGATPQVTAWEGRISFEW